MDNSTIQGQSLKDQVLSEYGIVTVAGREAFTVVMENLALLDRKQRDYGPHNISKHGVYGVVVRMTDKMERLCTLFRGGKRRKAINESIRDSFRDIANYAVIAILIDTKRWPTNEP